MYHLRTRFAGLFGGVPSLSGTAVCILIRQTSAVRQLSPEHPFGRSNQTPLQTPTSAVKNLPRPC
jgi:hypothetical protein